MVGFASGSSRRLSKLAHFLRCDPLDTVLSPRASHGGPGLSLQRAADGLRRPTDACAVIPARRHSNRGSMRAIEVGAAALIVAFGILLLAGYMASEQLWMFTG
jgi:hypothetical protein